MSKPVPTLLLAALATLFAAAAVAQTYRWVGQDGKVNYSNTPPPSAAKNVQSRNSTPSVVESSQQPYAVQQAVKNFPVVLYTHADCKELCVEGRKLLASRGVPYREVAVADEKTQAELKQVTGDTQVPVLLVGKQVSRGYESEMWNTALDAAGYPKAGSPAAQASKSPAPPPAEATQAAAKADKPQQAAAEPAAAGRYAPLPPDPKAPPPPAGGKYLPQ
jgi:glutaredoxin